MAMKRCYKNVIIILFGSLSLFFGIVAGQVSGDGDVRLRDGPNTYSGRVEIYHDGQWGTVCDDDWDINDALVTCRQLGYQSAIQAYSEAHFGQGNGEIFLDNVQCGGYETRLENCQNLGWSVHNCGHHEDAGVECSYVSAGDGDVRLRDGPNTYSGRVEIYHDGQWGTVCDDDWDINDALVTCRQLGYQSAIQAYSDAHFGQGNGEIFLDNVQCGGYETRLENCQSLGWSVHNCGHHEDAGVDCSHGFHMTTPYSWQNNLRLVGGSSRYEGRVEVYDDGKWNTVCDDYWGAEDAAVVCRQLGFEGPAEAFSGAYFGAGEGDIILDNVDCTGWETTLLRCPSNDLYEHDCQHREDAGVKCGRYDFDMTTPYWWQNRGDVRLVGGLSPNEGRVEIYYDRQWNTVCDDSWDITDAYVVCRQLGYEGSAEAFNEAYFGDGEGDIILDDVECFGWESTLLQCPSSDLYVHNCRHSEDAGVRCEYADPGNYYNDGSVRLVDGDNDYSGRVEIYYSGEWGTVCDDGWSIEEADIVCKQLGYPSAFGYETNAYFGPGSGPIMLDDVSCDGSEHALTQCNHMGWYNHNCDHNEDVAVICQIPVTYYPRLVDGNTWYEGRVEVWDGSRWEKMCRDNFYHDEASTVCRQIGFSDYDEILSGGHFGSGNAPPSDVRFDCNSYDNELGTCYVYEVAFNLCESVELRCKQNTSMNSGVIAAIVIVSVFVFVCISVGLLVSYRHSKQHRAGAQPVIAVVSGRTNLSGPSASQLNHNNIAQPPSYYEVMNNPGYRGQHVSPCQLQQAGIQSCFPQPNQGTIAAGQPVSTKNEFVYPYPVQNSLGYAPTPPYPVQPSHNPPVHEEPGQPSFLTAPSVQPSPSPEPIATNTGTDC